MDITLSPDFERQAIEQIRVTQRDENVPKFRLGVVKITAKLLVYRVLQRVLTGVADRIIGSIERRNARLHEHVEWFRSAAQVLRDAVAQTGVPAGIRLISALDDVQRAVDKSIARLLPLVEQVNARSELGLAVHRSVRLLSELKVCAAEMKRAGNGSQTDEFTLRGDASHQRLMDLHSDILAGTVQSRPKLQSSTRAALEKLAG